MDLTDRGRSIAAMKTSGRRAHITLGRGWTALLAMGALVVALAAPASAAASPGFTPSSLSISRNGGVVTVSATSFVGDLASALTVDWLPSENGVVLQVVSPATGRMCLSPSLCSSRFVGSNPAGGSSLDIYFNDATTFTLTAQAVDLTPGGYFVRTDIAPVSITVVVRATAVSLPTVTITSPQDGATYTLGETVLADYSCAADAGLASCVGPVPSGGAIDTSTVGTHEFTVVATDDLDQTAATTVVYRVDYGFDGFLAPVPESVDAATAGRSIPLRWRLTQADGSPVTSLDPSDVSVGVVSRPCSLGETEDLPFSEAGDSPLQSLGDGYYRLVWKTSRTYAGSCKTLSLDVGDGVSHTLEVDFVR